MLNHPDSQKLSKEMREADKAAALAVLSAGRAPR